MDVADIFRAAWPAYVAKFGRLIPPEQHTAARAILRCRTPALGGQLYRCDCGREHYAYHSCNHRACPKCAYHDNALWLPPPASHGRTLDPQAGPVMPIGHRF